MDRTDAELFTRYRQLATAGWGMFGANADRARVEIVTELRKRGYTHAPNIFGPIPLDDRATPRPSGLDEDERVR